MMVSLGVLDGLGETVSRILKRCKVSDSCRQESLEMNKLGFESNCLHIFAIA